ncbi:uncharacterized protein [Watersipora subatra]|uniref:uncharacterized protein n=1 Tax=Watersipora subatra TaxID=2589382 RepID=UPI00355B6878
MKRKLELLEPIEDPCRVVLKRFKEKRTKILKQSLKKLKKIPDAEQCLRQAVLIRNTFIRAKDLSPKHFERQLLTLPQDTLNKEHSDLLDDLHEQSHQIDMEVESDAQASEHQYKSDIEGDISQQSCQSECAASQTTINSRQLLAVS